MIKFQILFLLTLLFKLLQLGAVLVPLLTQLPLSLLGLLDVERNEFIVASRWHILLEQRFQFCLLFLSLPPFILFLVISLIFSMIWSINMFKPLLGLILGFTLLVQHLLQTFEFSVVTDICTLFAVVSLLSFLDLQLGAGMHSFCLAQLCPTGRAWSWSTSCLGLAITFWILTQSQVPPDLFFRRRRLLLLWINLSHWFSSFHLALFRFDPAICYRASFWLSIFFGVANLDSLHFSLIVKSFVESIILFLLLC